MRPERYLNHTHREWLAIGLAAAVGAVMSEKLIKPKLHKGLKVKR